MANLDVGQTTTTTLTGNTEYTVGHETPDNVHAGEQWYDFPEAAEYLGYYKKIPELKKAIDALAIWTVGKGVEVDDTIREQLRSFRGWGEDTFQSIMENLIMCKKIFGDAFAEIMRNDDEKIVNIKPLYPGDMRVVVDNKGMIKRYEQRVGVKTTKFRPDQILHLCNDRVANEIHGTSVIEACKWVINARNEALTDHRKVIHRNAVPVRIIEVDTDNTAKRNQLITEYESAIKNGEVLVIPKGTVDIRDTSISIQDPISWIQYLENFFYQAVGIPKVIATSEGFTEAASKVSYLTFEPIYTREQTLLEEDILAQLYIEVKFNRPPSLGSFMQKSEQKNTGQTGFQPNEVSASIGRTE